MKTIKGVVEKVSEKTGKGRKGTWCKIGVLIEDTWYNGFVKKRPAGLENGVTVTIEAEHNDEYGWQFDGEGAIRIVDYGGGSDTQTKSSSARNGASVGMALNNATLLIAHGIVPVDGPVSETILRVAGQILKLSDRLEKAPKGDQAHNPVEARSKPVEEKRVRQAPPVHREEEGIEPEAMPDDFDDDIPF